MRTVFISAGWPYLYEIPGLHNCIPMLFADSMARYRRLCGDKVVFTSGADEHGSRVEFVAEGAGKTPKALVDEKVAAAAPLLERLELSFDYFGRTTDPTHQRFVADFIERLLKRKAVHLRSMRIPFCAVCGKHLPDRFVEGFCPHCGQPAFGDQCGNKRSCGKVLDPFQLEDGRCAVCGSAFEAVERSHLYLPLDPYREALKRHIEDSYRDSPAVLERALRTLKTTEGLALTRDTEWGTPLPDSVELPGRSVYSWVDSLLGKLSSTIALGQLQALWEKPGAEKHFFLGADGIGFYAVLLPALLLAVSEDYAIEGFRIITNDVLIYEGGICSKSSRTGIWLPEALKLLDSCYWRFVIFHAEAQAAKTGKYPGSADLDFRWDSFARAANMHLGAIADLYESLEGTNPKPEPDAPELEAVRSAFEALSPGEAFGLLLGALTKASEQNRPGLATGSVPLLSCFLPGAAARAERILNECGIGPLFPRLPLDGAGLRNAYVRAVEQRRSGMDLTAELTDVRADALCVCPSRLDEN